VGGAVGGPVVGVTAIVGVFIVGDVFGANVTAASQQVATQLVQAVEATAKLNWPTATQKFGLVM